MAKQFVTTQKNQPCSQTDPSHPPRLVSEEQAFLVYKFIHTPSSMLTIGLSKMQTTQMSQFFRQLAKQLHPDKNGHPQAKDAF